MFTIGGKGSYGGKKRKPVRTAAPLGNLGRRDKSGDTGGPRGTLLDRQSGVGDVKRGKSQKKKEKIFTNATWTHHPDQKGGGTPCGAQKRGGRQSGGGLKQQRTRKLEGKEIRRTLKRDPFSKKEKSLGAPSSEVNQSRGVGAEVGRRQLGPKLDRRDGGKGKTLRKKRRKKNEHSQKKSFVARAIKKKPTINPKQKLQQKREEEVVKKKSRGLGGVRRG